jgi:hypothetical protein
MRDLERRGLLIPSSLISSESVGISSGEVGDFLLECERVPFITYPYEWSFDMLRDSALVFLEVLESAFQEGFILKDATAFNILFLKNKPIFIDLSSFERYKPGTPWAGYSQFCRAFLFPLMIQSYRRVNFQELHRAFLAEIPLSVVKGFFRFWDIFKPGVFKDVFLQGRLEGSFGRSSMSTKKDLSRFKLDASLLRANFNRLRWIIKALPSPEASTWSNYVSSHSYSSEDLERKKKFILDHLLELRTSTVLDLGCNWGIYSDLVRAQGLPVISMDFDSQCINSLYLRTRGMEHQSLVVNNILDPTPSMGWALKERQSLYERIQADSVLVLALLHHLRISGNVPLTMIIDEIAKWASQGVIEWVDKDDEMVQQMLALKSDIYSDYHWNNFETLLSEKFRITRTLSLKGGKRKLCELKRRI